MLRKDEETCCTLLVKLSELGSTKARAITAPYHILCAQSPRELPLNWLEEATSNGSYFAKECLRILDIERYQRVMSRPLNFEFASTDTNVVESELFRYARAGDYKACKTILESHTPLPTQNSGISPYHWLVSFSDEAQINDLVTLLIQKGAPLGLWEGNTKDNYTFGKVIGTPLCWAVWHRNIPLTRALLRAMGGIKVEVMNRLINLAAGLHFYDILEVFRITKANLVAGAKPNWQFALYCAGDIGEFKLARRLRHGDAYTGKALEKTLDVLLSVYKPTKEDVKVLFDFAWQKNSPDLMRYLFEKFDLAKRNDLLGDTIGDLVLHTIAAGQKEIFEIFIARGLISPNTEHGEKKWKPLQACVSSRQRDPYFAKRVVEIGCQVDAVGGTKDSSWTPFAMAVSSGRFDVATTLLELGADKDACFGRSDGTAVAMNLLQSWPDMPISCLKYLLEELPRLGFGHVDFWGGSGDGGNILYALAMSYWPSYTNTSRLEVNAKYILSQLADKNCLNRLDKHGYTALGMASAFGNLEVCKALVEAGVDVNTSGGPTPLNAALAWRVKCYEVEKKAFANSKGPGGGAGGGGGGGGRQAQKLRIRAEMTVDLLVSNGGIDRGSEGGGRSMEEWWTAGGVDMPSCEVLSLCFIKMGIIC